jgi:hypothetical protein
MRIQMTPPPWERRPPPRGMHPTVVRAAATRHQRRVAVLFVVHAIGELTAAWRLIYLDGPSRLPALNLVAEELAYAYFLQDASVAFDSAASSNLAVGLPVALDILCDLFQNMSIPLAVKSVILYGKWVAYWVRFALSGQA